MRTGASLTRPRCWANEPNSTDARLWRGRSATNIVRWKSLARFDDGKSSSTRMEVAPVYVCESGNACRSRTRKPLGLGRAFNLPSPLAARTRPC